MYFIPRMKDNVKNLSSLPKTSPRQRQGELHQMHASCGNLYKSGGNGARKVSYKEQRQCLPDKAPKSTSECSFVDCSLYYLTCCAAHWHSDHRTILSAEEKGCVFQENTSATRLGTNMQGFSLHPMSYLSIQVAPVCRNMRNSWGMAGGESGTCPYSSFLLRGYVWWNGDLCFSYNFSVQPCNAKCRHRHTLQTEQDSGLCSY